MTESNLDEWREKEEGYTYELEKLQKETKDRLPNQLIPTSSTLDM